MEEKIFDSYAEFNKFCNAKEEAYFNNEDMSQFDCTVRLTDKAWGEMDQSGDYYTIDEFMQELNHRIDSQMKKAEKRIQIHESQEEE